MEKAEEPKKTRDATVASTTPDIKPGKEYSGF